MDDDVRPSGGRESVLPVTEYGLSIEQYPEPASNGGRCSGQKSYPTLPACVRSLNPVGFVARILDNEKDWKKAETLALKWWEEKREGVDVHVVTQSGSSPKPEPSLEFRREDGWVIYQLTYDHVPPTTEDPHRTGHGRKRARAS